VQPISDTAHQCPREPAHVGSQLPNGTEPTIMPLKKKTWTMAKIIFLLPKEKKINFLLTQLEKSFPKNT
jgi:hypothetical protein